MKRWVNAILDRLTERAYRLGRMRGSDLFLNLPERFRCQAVKFGWNYPRPRPINPNAPVQWRDYTEVLKEVTLDKYFGLDA